MVFQYLPVYFDYQGRTWLIEFWKGQYGINTGAEIGLYYADKIIPAAEIKSAHFQAVSDKDMLYLKLRLEKGGKALAQLSKKTWWLTAFSMGVFSHPKDLYLSAALVFPNYEMLHCFLRGLSKTSLQRYHIQVHGLQVQILFYKAPAKRQPLIHRLSEGAAQFFNRIYCHLFLLITKRFPLTLDKLLYLYFLFPLSFTHTMRLRRWKGGRP